MEKQGFKLIRERRIDELDCTLYEYEHIKCGARLVYLDREDENKTFSIGFTTPPEDDSGVFHIIEHSVLCGSEKYPLKDPFAELLKGSLNTFLNAITFEDRTIYPVSSRCERDFFNLMDVYLDAVLHPNMLKNENIFMQEGWHLEYDGDEDTLRRSGVVYNEMKGAYSSPDELGGVALNRALFSDSAYRYDSGGDPSKIPSLSYDGLKAAHEKYYHPSSAKIVLDGRMDLDSALALIDGHLRHYDKRTPISIEGMSAPRKADTVTIKYEIPENESESGRARVLYGYVFSDFSDRLSQLMASVLSSVLCATNASPLKKALLERGLCKDAAVYTSRSRQLTLIIEVRDADEARLSEIDGVIEEVIRSLASEGIDKELLSATLSSIEFRQRERDFGTLPAGIAYAMAMYGVWVNGGLPEDALISLDVIAKAGELIKTDSYERALLSMTLDCPHTAKVIMLADKTVGIAAAEEEAEELRQLRLSLSEGELSEIVRRADVLHSWQEGEESDEALASLPALTVEDIPQKIDYPKAKKHTADGVEILHTQVKTNGIVYISLFFDTSDLAGEELLALSALAGSLLNFKTKSYSPLALQSQIKARLGSLFASFTQGTKGGEDRTYLKIGGSALSSRQDDLIELIGELISTKIDDEAEFANILSQQKSMLEEAIISSGDSFATSRVMASILEGGAIAENVTGLEAYFNLSEILSDKEKISRLRHSVCDLLCRATCKKRLSVIITGETDLGFEERLLSLFPEGEGVITPRKTELCADKSEYLVTPSKVGYAVAGGVSERVRENYGLMRVIRSILSYEYLWNTVRVKSGAYGTGFSPRYSGAMSFFSYRDPSPERSLGFYRESAEYLRSLADAGADITKFIIGAIGESDIIITPKTAMRIISGDYLDGITPEEVEKIRADMLSVKTEDLRLGADIIDSVLCDGSVAIVGGAHQLAELENPPKKVIKI